MRFQTVRLAWAIPGQDIDETREMAEARGADAFIHNGRLFPVDSFLYRQAKRDDMPVVHGFKLYLYDMETW